MADELDYTLLFRSLPALLLVLSPELRVAEATDAYLHATMRERDEIVGREMFDVFPDDPRDPGATGVRNLRRSLERVRREHVPDVMAVQKYGVRNPLPDDPDAFAERYWSPVNSPVLGADGRLQWIIHRVEDVTAFVHAAGDERALDASDGVRASVGDGSTVLRRMAADVVGRAQEIQEANRELRTTVAALAVARDQARAAEHRVSEILESITDAFCALDAHCRFTYVNRAAEELWGRGRETLLGRDLTEVTPAALGGDTLTRVERAMRARAPDEFETWAPAERKWLHVHLYPTADGLSVYLRDVTARRHMQERLALAQEEERRRLARELHDRMAQHLTAVALGVQALRQECGDHGTALRLLDQLQQLADRLGQEARALALSLRPTVLDDFGLASAIRDYVERWSADARIPVAIQMAGTEGLRLPFGMETAVYRIVVEALTNVARHADAGHVQVVLERHDDVLVAVVEDDGIGFDVDTVLRQRAEVRGLGLIGMQERAGLLGGTLVIDSSDAGTTVIARIPTGVGNGAVVPDAEAVR